MASTRDLCGWDELESKKSVSLDLDTKLVGNERGLIMLETNSKDESVSNARRQRLSTLLDVNCARPATMLQMALGDDARRKPTQYSRPALAQATFYHFHTGMIRRSDFLLSWSYNATRRVNSKQLVVPKCSQVFPIVRDLVTRTAHTFRYENVSENYQNRFSVWREKWNALSNTQGIFISKTCGPFSYHSLCNFLSCWFKLMDKYILQCRNILFFIFFGFMC